MCFRYAQTGWCRFGDGCRFQHVQAGVVANPERYTKYTLSWDEGSGSSDGATNSQALMETLRLARAAKLARSGDGGDGGDAAAAPHTIGDSITFVPRSKRGRITGGGAGGSSAAAATSRSARKGRTGPSIVSLAAAASGDNEQDGSDGEDGDKMAPTRPPTQALRPNGADNGAAPSFRKRKARRPRGMASTDEPG